MNDLGSAVLPLVRPWLLRLGLAVALLGVVWGGLYATHDWLKPDWQQAQAQRQAAQARLDEARTDQKDIDTHRRTYDSLRASGLLGGEPRALWVESLLRTASDMGLQGQVSFNLATPVAVDLPQAQAVGGRVTRHVLEFSLKGVHEVEALQLVDRYVAAHEGVARLMGCTFDGPTPQGLALQCRVNFLHIDPPMPAGQNGGS